MKGFLAENQKGTCFFPLLIDINFMDLSQNGRIMQESSSEKCPSLTGMASSLSLEMACCMRWGYIPSFLKKNKFLYVAIIYLYVFVGN